MVVRRPTVRDPQGFALGVFFVALGAAGFAFAHRYAMGTAIEMGPGWLPRALAGALVFVGVLVVAGALRFDGPTVDWRPVQAPLAWLVAAVAAFALLVDRAGLVPAMAVLVALSLPASRQAGRLEAVAMIVLLPALAVLVFVTGLGVRLPLWPWSP